ncbi:LacI family DNA-binding transcriptional regulator [uncultured Alsobacter sp.]|uniref:LacI family DNA-binding transcriptional regulator n=1 Tax=uncultured Alsobacter sp. TaxID=1748258 RepID=UPI0025E0969E|nr:LacI family DNA-binding transcriptional regulator [uncultured Alsobacter sp.]
MHSQSEADWEDRVDALLGDSARRVTSYDVAKLAGVSQSAVSRTFRDGGSVSPETRAKVERAAQALGYAPNIVARSLITRRSNLIAVLVTAQTSRNYPEVLFQLGQEIQARGNRMLVFTVDFDALAAEVFNDLAGYHVDGIVAATSMEPDLLEACERHRIPLVLYNRVPRGGFASAVGCDHATGMSDLVDHLVGGTPRRVAFVAGPKGAVVSEDRLAGARQALVRHGLAIDEVIHADYSYDGGRAVGRDLLARKKRPDTVLCANDAMALGLMDSARFDLGLSVPADVQVTGFDDLPESAWPSHDLTTLRQPVEMLTRAAIRMLEEHIAGTAIGSERRLMPAELKIRGSTRRPAG